MGSGWFSDTEDNGGYSTGFLLVKPLLMVRYLRNESCLQASNRCASLNSQPSRARLKPSKAASEAWKTRQVMSKRAT